MNQYIADYVTGSRRGYIRVADRDTESGLKPIPTDVTGLRGNYRKAMVYLNLKGATCYTISHCQGVPDKGYSNQYCYTVYRGYKEV